MQKGKKIKAFSNSFLKMKRTIFFVFAFFMVQGVFANPVLDQVTSGDVTVQTSGSTLTVNQNSQQAAIDWRSFNIAADETTHFQQPAGGIALNRVDARQGPSEIFGRLSATGQIILTNSAGIFFRSGSQVDVGGLIATTGQINLNDFANGNYSFTNIPYNSEVVNEGAIRAAQNGLIALVGGNVRNDGTIDARLGTVALASGSAFTVSFSNDGLIQFALNDRTLRDDSGNRVSGSVSTSNTISVSSDAARSILDNSINMNGIPQAQSISEQNGEIILGGSDQGVVRVAGKVDASNKSAGKHGGKITVTGHNIVLEDHSILDASGDAGGGLIRLDGANVLYMSPDSEIYADAVNVGNGGEVILNSNLGTFAYGTIFARGGAVGGNGGLVETSGKYLDINGIHINVNAPYGENGLIVLDPFNIYIAASLANAQAFAFAPMVSSTNVIQQLNGFYAGGANGVPDSLFLTATLNGLLDGGATVRITTQDGTNTGTGTGNIYVVDPVTWNSSRSSLFVALQLYADNNIYVNAPITNVVAGGTIPTLIQILHGTVTLNVDNAFGSDNFISLSGGGLNLNGHDLALSLLTGSPSSTLNLGSNALSLNNTFLNLAIFEGTISGTAASKINLNGTGSREWSVRGDNSSTFNGDIFLSGGVLAYTTKNAFGSGTIHVSGGRIVTSYDALSESEFLPNNIVLNGTDLILSADSTGGIRNYGFSGSISGTGNIISNASGLSLSGANTVTGSITANSGNLSIYTANSLANTTSIVMNPNSALQFGTLTTSVPIVLNNVGTGYLNNNALTGSGNTVLNGPITVTGSNQFGAFLGSLVVNGTISGTGSITLTGPSSIALNGNNTYSGGTIMSSPGALFVGNNNALGTGLYTHNSGGLRANAGPVTLPNDFLLNAKFTYTGLSNLTLNGSIVSSSSSNGITLSSAATLTLNGNNPSYTGTTQVNSGKLIVNNANALGVGNLIVVDSAFGVNTPLVISNSYQFYGAVALGGSASLELSGSGFLGLFTDVAINQNATLSGNVTGTGGLTVNNNNTLTLSGNNTGVDVLNSYSGSITVNNGGVLNITNAANNNILAGTGSLGYGSVLINDGGTLNLDGVEINNPTSLSSIALDGSGLNGAHMTISGNSVLNQPVVLTSNSNAIIDLGSGSTFTMNGDMNGSAHLIFTGAGSVLMNGVIANDMQSISSDVDMALNGGNVTTLGSQTYNGMVTLGSNMTLTASGITLNGGVNGNGNSLILADSSTSQLGGALTNLDSFTTNAVQMTNSDVTTANDQTYNGLVTLGSNITLSTTNTGNVNLHLLNGVTGGFDLNLTAGVTANEDFLLNGLISANSVSVFGPTDGGATLTVNGGNVQTWNITTFDAGNIVNSGAGSFTFTRVQNLIGGDSNDNIFVLNGGTLSGTVNGGLSGNNTMIGDNLVNTWTVTGLNAGTVNGISGGFSNIQNWIGGTSTDTLIGANVANTWNITGFNTGSLTNVSSFSGMENLWGGLNDNNFIFSDGASISGLIDGRGLSGVTNQLSYFPYTTGVNVFLSSTNNGISVNGATTITNFVNITNLLAKNTIDNYLFPPAGKQNVVVVTGFRKGFINDPIFFDGFITPSTILTTSNTPNLPIATVLLLDYDYVIPRSPYDPGVLTYTTIPIDVYYDEVLQKLIFWDCAYQRPVYLN